MNPLARALKLAEDPRTEPAAHNAGRTPDPALGEHGEPGLVRAAGDEPVPEAAPPAAARTAPAGTVAGARCGTAGSAPGDAGAARAATLADFRPLRRRRGIGRFVRVSLSLLVAAGVAAVGGTRLWKTELARPALVRHLPPLPVAVMDLTPVRAANAAAGETPEPAAGVAPRTEALPAGSKAPHAEAGRPAASAAVPAASAAVPAASAAVPAASAAEVSVAGFRAPGTPPDPRRIATAGGPTPAPERDAVEPRAGSGTRVVIRKRIRADHVAASLERAWEAYIAGDTETAGQAYRAVLEHEPRNRDARLGLAAVAARAGRWGEAAEHYATLLASHPADTAARAALTAIGEKDPARAESRLKALLRIEPEAAHLHFSLGNLYAAQSRWPEARQSWLSAYRFDRGNADHAYNLAVGLDHLSQSRNALDLYREALVLARSSPASFQAETVLKRIRALESRPDAEPAPDGTAPDEAAAAAAAHVR